MIPFYLTELVCCWISGWKRANEPGVDLLESISLWHLNSLILVLNGQILIGSKTKPLVLQ